MENYREDGSQQVFAMFMVGFRKRGIVKVDGREKKNGKMEQEITKGKMQCKIEIFNQISHVKKYSGTKEKENRG